MENNYWKARMANAQDLISQKNHKQIERILSKYYRTAAQGVIDDFITTYTKVLSAMEKGVQPTPADLYKLDSYWQMQSQLDVRLKQLGEREQSQMLRAFKRNYWDVYEKLTKDLSVLGLNAFSTIDEGAVTQVINAIWCTDGLSWSQRIWKNTALLKETLNEELIRCVTTGKNPSYLKKVLQERFNVAFNNADMLVRTELAHIQTQAAKQRYRDYGIQQVEVLADKDERRCEHCGKLHGKRYSINDVMPVPAHPRCRCCMIPVID